MADFARCNADTSIDVLMRARETKTLRGLHNCLGAAKHRVADALAMPWPALAESWQRTYDEIAAMCKEREAEPHPAVMARAAAMRDEGMTYADIGRAIGRAASTTRVYVRGRNAAREYADEAHG